MGMCVCMGIAPPAAGGAPVVATAVVIGLKLDT